jgi:hypothetical protein
MPLKYWYKDPKTKESCYYDTDDLNNQQYARVCELEKQMSESNADYLKLRRERDDIIWRALHGSQD